jgi:hypothetical protein
MQLATTQTAQYGSALCTYEISVPLPVWRRAT